MIVESISWTTNLQLVHTQLSDTEEIDEIISKIDKPCLIYLAKHPMLILAPYLSLVHASVLTTHHINDCGLRSKLHTDRFPFGPGCSCNYLISRFIVH